MTTLSLGQALEIGSILKFPLRWLQKVATRTMDKRSRFHYSSARYSIILPLKPHFSICRVRVRVRLIFLLLKYFNFMLLNLDSSYLVQTFRRNWMPLLSMNFQLWKACYLVWPNLSYLNFQIFFFGFTFLVAELENSLAWEAFCWRKRSSDLVQDADSFLPVRAMKWTLLKRLLWSLNFRV